MLLSSFGEEKSGDVHGHHFSDLILGFLTNGVWFDDRQKQRLRRGRRES
jgi:hypothetical protein